MRGTGRQCAPMLTSRRCIDSTLKRPWRSAARCALSLPPSRPQTPTRRSCRTTTATTPPTMRRPSLRMRTSRRGPLSVIKDIHLPACAASPTVVLPRHGLLTDSELHFLQCFLDPVMIDPLRHQHQPVRRRSSGYCLGPCDHGGDVALPWYPYLPRHRRPPGAAPLLGGRLLRLLLLSEHVPQPLLPAPPATFTSRPRCPGSNSRPSWRRRTSSTTSASGCSTPTTSRIGTSPWTRRWCASRAVPAGSLSSRAS